LAKGELKKKKKGREPKSKGRKVSLLREGGQKSPPL